MVEEIAIVLPLETFVLVNIYASPFPAPGDIDTLGRKLLRLQPNAISPRFAVISRYLANMDFEAHVCLVLIGAGFVPAYSHPPRWADVSIQPLCCDSQF